MEMRIFDRPVMVWSIDGNHFESFAAGDQVKNVQRFGKRVMFEPADSRRIAGTYVMDWSEFNADTIAVRGVRANGRVE